MADIRARIDELKRKLAAEAQLRLAQRDPATDASTPKPDQEQEPGGVLAAAQFRGPSSLPPTRTSLYASHASERLDTAAFHPRSAQNGSHAAGTPSSTSTLTTPPRTQGLSSSYDGVRAAADGHDTSERLRPTWSAAHASPRQLTHRSDAETAASAFHDTNGDARRAGTPPASAPLGETPGASADDVVALRSQVASLAQTLRQLDAQRAAAAAERDEAKADAASAAAARDDLARKLAMLKQRLVTEQSEAEEASTWQVQEALRQTGEAHASEIARWREETDALRARTEQLEQALTAARAVASAGDRVPALEQRVADLQHRLAATEAQVAKQRAALERCEAVARQKDEQIDNLQAALGELTYEAEASNRARLELHRTQAELRTAQDARVALEGALAQARADATSHAAQAAELRHRCLAAEERSVALGDEALRLRGALSEARQAAAAAEADHRTIADQRAVAAAVARLVTRRGERAEALRELDSLVSFSDEERAAMGLPRSGEDGPRPRGLLGRIARLPAILLTPAGAGPQAAAGPPASKGVTRDWVSFLTDADEASGAAALATSAAADEAGSVGTGTGVSVTSIPSDRGHAGLSMASSDARGPEKMTALNGSLNGRVDASTRQRI